MAARGHSAGKRPAKPPRLRPGGAVAARGPGRFLHTAAFAALVGAICSLNSLSNGFAFDDNAIIVANPRIADAGNFRGIWLSDWWQPLTDQDRIANRTRDRLYRPMAMFSFALNHAVHGLDPLGYHAVNIMLHALACWLVWVFARRLFGDTAVATVAALLFAVHPIHCEAVANVVGRAEILATVFLLSGLVVLMPRGRDATARDAAIAAAGFLAALLSKETAVCYPLLALVVLAAGGVQGGSRSLRALFHRERLARLAILLIPLAVYFPMRYAALEGHLLRDRSPSSLNSPLIELTAAEPGRYVTPIRIVGAYARLIVAPGSLSSDYGLGVVSTSAIPDMAVFGGLAVVAGIAAALFGLRARSLVWRRLGVSAALLAASYALISNTVLIIGVSMAERLMYWPSVPAIILLATLLVAGWRRYCGPGGRYAGQARQSLLIGGVFLAALGARSVVRNADWHDNATLFLTDVQTYPASATLNINAARVLHDRGTPAALAQAAQHLDKALKIDPRNPRALHVLALVYARGGRVEDAIRYVTAALQYDASNADARQLLTLLERKTGAADEQIEKLNLAVDGDPQNVPLRLELGRVLRNAGRQPEAHIHFEQAARLAPDEPDAQYAWGESLALNNEPKRAEQVFRRVLELDPLNWRAHANLSTLVAGSDSPAALRHARTAHELEPNVYQTNINLAESLAINDFTARALNLFRRIRRGLDDSDPRCPFVDERIRDLETGRP